MTENEYLASRGRLREASIKKRAQAWCVCPDRVLGIELQPLTPARYSVLVGSENAFVCGGIPTLSHLRNFVWFCSREFDPDQPAKSMLHRGRVMRRLNRALLPHFTFHQRLETVKTNFDRAIADIRQIAEDTFFDAIPSRSGDNDHPLGASLEAQMIDCFIREYGSAWPFKTPIRHTPLKQLFQLMRCIDRRYLGEKDPYADLDERRLDLEYLRSINPGT